MNGSKNQARLPLVGLACLLLIWIASPVLPQALTLSIPDTTVSSNSLLKIPIRTTDVTGLGIVSIGLSITFDEKVLDALGANSLGTLSETWGNPLTTDAPGKIELQLRGSTPLTGEGVVTYLFFDVTGNDGDTTTIRLNNIQLNGGAISAASTPGKFQILPTALTSRLLLTMPDSSASAGSIIQLPLRLTNPLQRAVDSLRVTLTFNKYVAKALGLVRLNTLTQSWSDSIESLLPGKISFLLKGQSAISDSGTLCFIQFQAIGLPGMATRLHFQGVQFYPDTLIAHGRNSTLSIAGGISPPVSVFIPDISADTAATITVPVYISDVSNKGIGSVSMHLHFQPQVLQYISSNLTNSILAGWFSLVNVQGDSIALGAFGATELTGQGLLAEFTFRVVGRPGMQSGLTFTEMMLNEGDPAVVAYDGLFTVNFVIPVELSSFSARVIGREVLLSWETTTETNNYGFGIERRSLETDWRQIGFVPGAGTTTSPQSYAFADKDLSVGDYQYRLKQIDFDGQYHYSQTISIAIEKPRQFQLFQNYPNPFNATTAIRFDLPERSNIRLVLFDVRGRQVAVLARGEFAAGAHNIAVQVQDLPSGIYFYQLETDHTRMVKKLLNLK